MESYRLKHVTFTYPGAERPALESVSLSLEQGEFAVLCGPSGCGKSTLLRLLKSCLAPHGTLTGEILLGGEKLETISNFDQARAIGFVLQSPEHQVVTDKVWHELAFGLESLGESSDTIRRRVAETAAFFGIEGWFYRDVSTLSGGQKQLLALASVMAMQPKILVLDEPTAQLDPIAAGDFFGWLGKINRELGTTILLSEHRMEEVFPYASRVLVMDAGRVVCDGAPGEVGRQLQSAGSGMFLAMPAAMRIWAAVDSGADCPLTVAQGRAFLAQRAGRLQPLAPEEAPLGGQPLLQGKGLWFRYEKEGADVVKGLDITLRRGELFALLGGNGTGKTTALKALSGLVKPWRGQVTAQGRLAMLPQNPQSLFVKNTVGDDLLDAAQELPRQSRGEELRRVARICQLEGLLERHPFDLSGGEQQRLALAKVLLTQPDILLLDEPTKGLDARFRRGFGRLLRQLCRQGIGILMVSHDTAFCAEHAHRCGLFFDGALVAQGSPRAFFSGNSFYTTTANRLAREHVAQAVTVDDVITAWGGVVPEDPELPPPPPPAFSPEAPQKKGLSLWRKVLGGLLGTAALGLFGYILLFTDVASQLAGGSITLAGQRQLWLYGAMAVCLVGWLLAISAGGRGITPVKSRGRRSGRSLLASGAALALIPLTIYIGLVVLRGQHWTPVAIAVLLECLAPFALMFEGRKPQARELVLLAVLCAIGVAGRGAFFMLPQFKPVLALTVIAGVAFGCETGFLVGSVTMLVSNMLFSQGPWTPWQMFAMGTVGLLAGLLFHRGWLRCGRVALAVFGAVSAVVVYGGIMNLSSALTWNAGNMTAGTVLAYYLSGLPMDLVHGASSGAFLLLISRPMLEKLERVKKKYGLVG